MNQSVQVNWDPGYFGRANAVRVSTPDNITNELTVADPADGFLGTYTNQAPGTKVVRTRICCFVPPKYVPLFMGTLVEP